MSSPLRSHSTASGSLASAIALEPGAGRQRPAGAEQLSGRRRRCSSSTSPAVEQRARRARPRPRPAARSARGARARRARRASRRSRSPASSITSAPASRSAPTRAGSAPAAANTKSGASSIDRTSAESSGSRAFESNTTRAGWRTCSGNVDVARGEQRVVGERGPDPDRDGVGLGAPAVDERAALGPRDPPRVAGRGGGEAVEADRRLQRHQRQAGARVLAKRLHQRRAPPRPRRRRRTRPRRPRRAGSPARARRPSRSGRRSRSPRGRSRRRGSRRCRAAGGPGGRRARG